MGDAEVPAVLRGHLEIRVDRVHGAVVAQRRVEIQHLLRDVEAVRAVQRILQRIVRVAHDVRPHDGHAVVGEAVRDPDVRRAATEQAEAAVDGRFRRPLPVEADARHEEFAPVERLLVVETVAPGEVLVEQRLVAAGEPVDADAGLDLEVRRRLPFVLQVQAVDVVAEFRGGVRGDVGERVGVGKARGRLAPEIVDAGERPLALAARHEDIEDVEHLALVADQERVVADEEAARQLDRIDVVGELVGLAELVRADVYRAAARRADQHLAEFGAEQRHLRGVDFLARELQLRGEEFVPVREQLQGRGLHQDRPVVPVRRRAEARQRRVVVGQVHRQFVALGALVGKRRAVRLVDVPVELGEDLLVLLRRRAQVLADVVAVHVEADLADLVVLGLRHAGNFDREARAGRADVLRGVTLELFVGEEEEEPVLDDRAAERAAVDPPRRTRGRLPCPRVRSPSRLSSPW